MSGALPVAQGGAPPDDEAPHLHVVDDDGRLRKLLSRYLTGNRNRLPYVEPEPPQVGGTRSLVAVPNHDGGAFFGKPGRHRQADACRTARDDRTPP